MPAFGSGLLPGRVGCFPGGKGDIMAAKGCPPLGKWTVFLGEWMPAFGNGLLPGRVGYFPGGKGDMMAALIWGSILPFLGKPGVEACLRQRAAF